MSKRAFIIGVLAVLLLLVSPSTAEIETNTITLDSRPLILFENFGFTNTGHVTITASSVSVVAPSLQPNLTRLGFFLTSETSLLPEQNPNLCILDSPNIIPLFTFLDLPPLPVTFRRSYPINISNEYSLYFENCVLESSVTMTVDTELYNLNPDGSRNYLSAGQTLLPLLLFLFSFPYLSLFLTFVLYLCHVSQRYSIDWLSVWMLLLLLVQALNLLIAALDMHYVKVNGTSDVWEVTFTVLFGFFLAPLMFFSMMLNEKPFLHPVVGMKLLILVILIKFFTFPGFKFFYWCGVVFLIVWSIISSLIRCHDPANAMSTNLLYKLNRVMLFYLVVIGYFVFVPFGISTLKTAVGYEHEWVSNLVDETASFVFCIVIMFYVLGFLEKKDQYPVIKEEMEELQVAEIAVLE